MKTTGKVRDVSRGPFDTPFESLPAALPVFPLCGALLLPRCRLPLNIFEPRYLSMTEDALAGQRLIGMVQPIDIDTPDGDRAFFSTGCAGRISSFSETDDGRILIILTGVSRFDVEHEIDAETVYRQVVPQWDRFRLDMEEEVDVEIDRDRLYASLRGYFESRDLDTDWDVLNDASDESLVNSLSMSCPFGPEQKQALLEAEHLGDRWRLMLKLLDMAALELAGGDNRLQ